MQFGGEQIMFDSLPEASGDGGIQFFKTPLSCAAYQLCTHLWFFILLLCSLCSHHITLITDHNVASVGIKQY